MICTITRTGDWIVSISETWTDTDCNLMRVVARDTIDKHEMQYTFNTDKTALDTVLATVKLDIDRFYIRGRDTWVGNKTKSAQHLPKTVWFPVVESSFVGDV